MEETRSKPVGWPWSGAVLFLSLWTTYKFGWCDVVVFEACHILGGSGGMPPKKFLTISLSEAASCGLFSFITV